MTLQQARKILGLAVDEDPRPHFDDFQKARDHIATMVRTAPDPEMTGRYMKGLVEFDEALGVVKQSIRSADQTVDSGKRITLGQRSEPVAPPSRRGPYLVGFLLIFLIAGGAIWFLFGGGGNQVDRTKIASLEKEGNSLIESRRWQEAREVFSKLEKLDPESRTVDDARRRIETGISDEQNQFIGYWTGQATAELEAGRLDEAETAVRQVLDKYPAENDAMTLLKNIGFARSTQARTKALAAAHDALDQKRWTDAMNLVKPILDLTPEDPDAVTVVNAAKVGTAKDAADEMRALSLLKMALARDNGQFDQQAIDWLREAKSLAPQNSDIATQFEKQSSYTRALRVPEDYATPAEALENARDRDRIVIAAGSWKGPLVINAAIELQGAGIATTHIECPPADGSPITISPTAKGVRISGIAFRHETFAVGDDRYSAALVRGGSATFVDCKFSEASGHGLVVTEGGQGTVSRCRAAGNGWDGFAAIGEGTRLEVRESEAIGNFQHGIESWQGAAVILTKNRCEENSRNGIHADNGRASASIENNQLSANREFGLVLDSAGSGKVTGNTVQKNLLGGIVIRAAAPNVTVSSNQSTLNQGPGLVLEKGLPAAAYGSNSVSQNTGHQVLADLDLSGAAPPPQEIPPQANPVPTPIPATPANPPRAKIIHPADR